MADLDRSVVIADLSDVCCISRWPPAFPPHMLGKRERESTAVHHAHRPDGVMFAPPENPDFCPTTKPSPYFFFLLGAICLSFFFFFS